MSKYKLPFQKEYKYENLILFILSIVGIVLSILIFTDLLSIKSAVIENRKVLGIIIFILSIFSLFLAINSFMKDYKLKHKILKNVHQKIYDACQENNIANMFAMCGLNIDDYEVDKEKNVDIYFIAFDIYSVVLTIMDDSYSLWVDFTDDYYTKHPDDETADFIEQHEKLCDVEYTLSDNTSLDEIIEKINLFIENNVKTLDSFRNNVN